MSSSSWLAFSKNAFLFSSCLLRGPRRASPVSFFVSSGCNRKEIKSEKERKKVSKVRSFLSSTSTSAPPPKIQKRKREKKIKNRTHREDVRPRDDPDQLRARVDHRDPVHLVLEHQPGRVGDPGRSARCDWRRAHRVFHSQARGGAVFTDDVFTAEDADEGLGALVGDDGDARDLGCCWGVEREEKIFV